MPSTRVILIRVNLFVIALTLVWTHIPSPSRAAPVRPTHENIPVLSPMLAPILLGNFVWDDLDGDGIQDASEPGVPEVQAQLWNSTKSMFFASTTTNASGIYSLTAPGPGSYRIRVLLPAGASFSPKDQGGNNTQDSDINPSGGDFGFTDAFTLTASIISVTNLDAGLLLPPPITLGNFVWDDLDGDSIQDAGEPGIANVQVQLWNSTKTLLLASAMTNASGIYSLNALIPETYHIRVILPTSLSFILKDQGGNDNLDSDINPAGVNSGFTDPFTLSSGDTSRTNLDAGLFIQRIFLPVVLK